MAYKIRYRAEIDWVGAGQAPVNPNLGPFVGEAGAGGSTTMAFFNKPNMSNTTNTFTASDITALTNVMTNDIVAQMTAAMATIQTWGTGGPAT